MHSVANSNHVSLLTFFFFFRKTFYLFILAVWPNSFLSFYFILFFNFKILYWFCHISTWICHRYIHVPYPWTLLLLPHHTIPLGRPSAPAPSIQYRASNLDWQLVPYMILHMFQCQKIWNASRICVSSLRRGHANLLCIVPILVYVLPKRAPLLTF